MKPITFVFIAAALASCVASDKPNFTDMTQAELDAYNSTVALEERVYCAQAQVNPAWRRTKYVCVMVKDIEQEAANAADFQASVEDEFLRL